MRLYQVNENTVKRFSNEWQKNLTLNLFNAFDDLPIQLLHDAYNLPVVVASGGPSLTKQLNLLKKVRDNVLLIASGSTINTLISNNLEPDYVVSIDGGINNFRHYKELNLEKATLVYSLHNHEQIRENFQRRSIAFMSITRNDEYDYIDKLMDKKIGSLIGGSSVANFALDFAQKITTGPIAIIGQDLAYTDNKSHAENNKNYKKITEEYKKQRMMFYTEGYYGDQVLTDYSLLSMKRNFEKLIKSFKQPERIYNCTEGGVKLEGYQQLPFDTFCERYIDAKRKEVLNISSYSSRSFEEWKVFFQRVKEELNAHNKVHKLLGDATILLKQNRSNKEFNPKLLKRLGKIDEKLNAFFAMGFMSLIVQPIIIDVFNNYLAKDNETEEEKFKRVFDQTKHLYTSLFEAVKESKSNLAQLIIRIEKKILEMEEEVE